MKTYDKLVRNKIPEIISDKGIKATFRIADKNEHLSYLKKKLNEEVTEYQESEDIEELVDIAEVVFELARAKHNESFQKFCDRCSAKIRRNGDFSNRIILIDVEEVSDDQT